MDFRLLSIVFIWSNYFPFICATRLVCFFHQHNVILGKGFARFSVDNINPYLCTHLIYYHVDINETTYELAIEDWVADIDNKGFEKFVGLKNKNHQLKTMISVGLDRKDVTGKYSRLVNNSSSINSFTRSVVAFLREFRFDGINLHWFPSFTHNIGFTNLVVELKKVLKSHQYLLSAIGSPYENEIDIGYNVPLLNENLDFINLWTMDFHCPGKDATMADHHAPLYARSWDKNDWNAQFAVDYWINKGMSQDKIVLGIPLYGHSWKISSHVSTATLPVPALGAAVVGHLKNGIMAYNEICSIIRDRKWETTTNPRKEMGPYAVSPITPNTSSVTWVGYDGPAMAVVKSKYVMSEGLGGAFVWEISMDDHKDNCDGGKNPIITPISNALYIGISEEELGSCECVCPT